MMTRYRSRNERRVGRRLWSVLTHQRPRLELLCRCSVEIHGRCSGRRALHRRRQPGQPSADRQSSYASSFPPVDMDPCGARVPADPGRAGQLLERVPHLESAGTADSQRKHAASCRHARPSSEDPDEERVVDGSRESIDGEDRGLTTAVHENADVPPMPTTPVAPPCVLCRKITTVLPNQPSSSLDLPAEPWLTAFVWRAPRAS